jgi:hypothetical protein
MQRAVDLQCHHTEHQLLTASQPDLRNEDYASIGMHATTLLAHINKVAGIRHTPHITMQAKSTQV